MSENKRKSVIVCPYGTNMNELATPKNMNKLKKAVIKDISFLNIFLKTFIFKNKIDNTEE